MSRQRITSDIQFLYYLKETIEQKRGGRQSCDRAIESARNPRVRYVLEQLRTAERSHLRTLESLYLSLEQVLDKSRAA